MDEKACALDSIHLLDRRNLIDVYEKTLFARTVNKVFLDVSIFIYIVYDIM